MTLFARMLSPRDYWAFHDHHRSRRSDLDKEASACQLVAKLGSAIRFKHPISWKLATVLSLFIATINASSAVEIRAVDGAVFTGEIIGSSKNTISLKLDDEGMLMLPRDDVQSIRVRVEGAGIVEGPLLDWDGRADRIQADGKVVNVQDGVFVQPDQKIVKLNATLAIPTFEAKAAKELEELRLAVNRAHEDIYSASVGIQSLIKMKLLPSVGLDVFTIMTDASEETVALLDSREVELGLISLPIRDSDRVRSLQDDVRAVANLWERNGTVVQLVAAKDLPVASVYEITRVIFENLPFLMNMNQAFTDTSLDTALARSEFPVHPGADRYYRELGASSTDLITDEISNRHEFGTKARM